jgi:hypothetical protein
MGSGSIAADGVRLQAVPVDAGGIVTIAPTLLYADYRAWCAGSLVLSAGGDRIATTNKRLMTTRPERWQTRLLVRAPGRTWGSLVCAPAGRSVVVQSQAATRPDMSVDHSHWSLWRVGFDGRTLQLTRPPRGSSDDSPRFAGRTLFFVRSRRGVGVVYALRAGRLLGPFASLGRLDGYYGHRAWEYTVTP